MHTHPLNASEPSRIIETLRDSGFRVTEPRRAVVQALCELSDHQSAEQIYEAARSFHATVDLSTVYRTVEVLEELELVSRVQIGRDFSAFHLNRPAHWHLGCRNCHRVFDLPSEAVTQFGRKLKTMAGFEIDHEFAISGLCPGCARP